MGLAIASDAVRAVGVTGTHVRWAVEAERSPEEPLAAALTALLARCPLPRWPRPAVMVAIGPAHVQVKCLTGLPPLPDAAALAAVVRESGSRFFLQPGVPLVTTGVRPVAPGTAWAAAFDAPVLCEIQQACQAARLRVRTIAPTIVALGYALDGTHVRWRDGDVCTELMIANRGLAAVRRYRGTSRDETPPDADAPCVDQRPVAALTVLGDQAERFADAYGAVRIAPSEPLALRVGITLARNAPSRMRLRVAAAAALLASVAALLAPALVATHGTRQARERLTVLRGADTRARATERDLARVTQALDEVVAFERTRRSATFMLHDLARALPTGSAVVALQYDSAGGTLVALAPRAVQVMDALDHVRGLATPEILGPVTHETVGPAGSTHDVERVTVRFRVTPTPMTQTFLTALPTNQSPVLLPSGVPATNTHAMRDTAAPHPPMAVRPTDSKAPR